MLAVQYPDPNFIHSLCILSPVALYADAGHSFGSNLIQRCCHAMQEWVPNRWALSCNHLTKPFHWSFAPCISVILKVVLWGSPRCPDSHDLSKCQRTFKCFIPLTLRPTLHTITHYARHYILLPTHSHNTLVQRPNAGQVN